MDPIQDSITELDSLFGYPMQINGNDSRYWNTFLASVYSSDLTVEVEPVSSIMEFDLSSARAMSSSARAMSRELLDICIELFGDVHMENVCINEKRIDEKLNRRRYEDCCDQTETCVICLDELKCNEEASKLGCGHDFHFECIKEWLLVKNLCPLCQQKAL